jgi:hypothetical protein
MSSAITVSFTILIQQHNDKEVGTLDPMADGALPERGPAIDTRLTED